MPVVPPNSNAKILITGASGFVGQWVLRTLLDRGHTARVAVRSDAKAKKVKEVFSEDVSKLEFVVIEDMSKEGAFDEGVVGVDAVVHVATPFPREGESPEETLRIAQDASVGVFKSALKKGDTIKKIVVTSTIATVWTRDDKARTFTEKDDNQISPAAWDAGERDWSTVYENSKILSEKAIWDFLAKHKSDVKFDVSLINPPFVFGPNVQRVSSPSELQSSSQFWFKGILEGVTEPLWVGSDNSAWVDVRDLGEAHARALEKSEATGAERIIVSAGSFVWKEWLDALRAVAHSVLPKEKADELTKGLPQPLLNSEIKYKVLLDTTKEQRILGLTYRTKEETVRDTLAKAFNEGWV
ncbi:hypothetical protein NMY22_g4161 [Coprinellus aureogranulatus]|nr:hypothetical protein NMY22_g4161 [Coprinellus aureogranulatus]